MDPVIRGGGGVRRLMKTLWQSHDPSEIVKSDLGLSFVETQGRENVICVLARKHHGQRQQVTKQVRREKVGLAPRDPLEKLIRAHRR